MKAKKNMFRASTRKRRNGQPIRHYLAVLGHPAEVMYGWRKWKHISFSRDETDEDSHEQDMGKSGQADYPWRSFKHETIEYGWDTPAGKLVRVYQSGPPYE